MAGDPAHVGRDGGRRRPSGPWLARLSARAVVDDPAAGAVLRRVVVLMVGLIALTIPFGRPEGSSPVVLVGVEVMLAAVLVAVWRRLAPPLVVLRWAMVAAVALMTKGVADMVGATAAGGAPPLDMRLVAYGAMITALALLVLGARLGVATSVAVQAVWLGLVLAEPATAEQLRPRGELFGAVRYNLIVLLLMWGAVRVFTLLRDERDRLRDEARRGQEANERRQEREDLRARLLAEAAHELRTPLSTIAAGTETLAAHDEVLDDDVRSRTADAVLHAAARLDRRTAELLAAARDDAGFDPAERVEVDPAAMVAATLEDLSLMTEQHDVHTDLVQGAVAHLDPAALDHILTNLLHNATKYSPPGTRIDVRLRREGDCTVLVVADHGPGVPAAVRDDLFTPYTRDASHEEVEGTGVGLAVTRTWARRHGGDVRLLDHADGAAFEVRLPDHGSTRVARAGRGSDGGPARN